MRRDGELHILFKIRFEVPNVLKRSLSFEIADSPYGDRICQERVMAVVVLLLRPL